MLEKTHFYIVILSLFVSSLFGSAVYAGSHFTLESSTVNVKEGDVFTVTAKIIPPDVKNYTVKMTMQFSPDTLSVKAWNFSEKWIPVRKGGYDLLNNDEGKLMRTAGYPEGFDKEIVFGQATFVAKKSGNAIILLKDDSFILDANSNNIASLGIPVKLVIEKVVVEPKPQEQAPGAPPITNATQIQNNSAAPSRSAPIINSVGENTPPTTQIEESAGSVRESSETSVQSNIEAKKSPEATALQQKKFVVSPPDSQNFLIILLFIALVLDLIALTRHAKIMNNKKYHL